MGFSAYAGCDHVVHKDDDAEGHDWNALTGVLLVGDPLVEPGDLRATTAAVFDALVDRLYTADDHDSLSKVSQGDVEVPVPAGRYDSHAALQAVLTSLSTISVQR